MCFYHCPPLTLSPLLIAAERSGCSSFDYPQRSIFLCLCSLHCQIPIHPVLAVLHCHLPSSPLPRTSSSSLTVPNEAPWECSLAPSLKIDLLALCCFGGAAGTDCLPLVPYGLATPAFMQQTHSDHALALFFKLVCTQFQGINICRQPTHTSTNIHIK